MLRPIDIQNKEFEKKIKGYSCDEVDDFLDMVIQDYELLFKENQMLKNKIGLLTETVDRYKQLESTMEKSVDMARQAAEDEHAKRRQEMIALRNEIDQYKARFRAHCESLMNMLDNMN